MAHSASPTIPTYKTAAAVLERKTGSGLMLAGWTVARTLLIAPPMMVVGVPPRRALLGAALASALISSFALLKIYNAGGHHHDGSVAGPRQLTTGRPHARRHPRRLPRHRR